MDNPSAFCAFTASPCPRGSTRPCLLMEGYSHGFPVPAGIDPGSLDIVFLPSGLPRARGDRPSRRPPPGRPSRASPCPRGSTRRSRSTRSSRRGFPVPAGIDPSMLSPSLSCARLPRARGDRPSQAGSYGSPCLASPCPRGSTRSIAVGSIRCGGFPVPAGIDPIISLPGRAHVRLPRARGDRPSLASARKTVPTASPCPRGSTRQKPAISLTPPGFPVPAGIDPASGQRRARSRRLPRARGDRPLAASHA